MPQRTLSEQEFNDIKDKVLASLPDNLTEEEFGRAVGPRMAAALGEAESLPAAPEGSGIGRYIGGAATVLNPMNLVNAALHPVQAVQGIATGSADQAGKAVEAFKQGNYLGAAGHALGTVPVIGPAAAHAGERIAEGDIAGGLGEATGLLAPFGVRAAMEARNVPNPRASEILTRQAEDQVAQQVLAPGNPRFKGKASALAPEVLARKLSGGRDDLRQAAVEGMQDAANRIDATIQASGGTQAPVPAGAVVAQLQSRIASLKDSNGVPLSDAAAKRITALQKRITQVRGLAGRTGTVRYDDLKSIRDENYRIADEARGYERMGNPAMSDEGWAARETGGSIRAVFAQRNPDTAAANADYAFWKSLNDVLDPVQGRPKPTSLPSGVTGGSRTVGAVVGQMSKIPGASFVLSTVVPWVRERIASPEWQLASAAKKLELAKAVKAGDIGRMKSAMSRFGQATAVSTNPSGRPTANTEPALP